MMSDYSVTLVIDESNAPDAIAAAEAAEEDIRCHLPSLVFEVTDHDTGETTIVEVRHGAGTILGVQS